MVEPVDAQPEEHRVAAVLLLLIDGLVGPAHGPEAHDADLRAGVGVDPDLGRLQLELLPDLAAVLALEGVADGDPVGEARREGDGHALHEERRALARADLGDDFARHGAERESVVADDRDLDRGRADLPGGAVEDGALGDDGAVNLGVLDREGDEVDAGDVGIGKRRRLVLGGAQREKSRQQSDHLRP